MAVESLVAVGAVASIIEIVQTGGKVLDCIQQYETNSKEVPETFRRIKDVLPVLQKTLGLTQAEVDAGALPTDILKALEPVLAGCETQIQELYTLFSKVLPQSKSRGERAKKALYATTKESKVKTLVENLLRTVNILTFYHAAKSSTSHSQTGYRLDQIRSWLSAPDPFSNYHMRYDERLAGTGKWFLEGTHYQEWKSQGPSFLWLHGIPGSGKTVLSTGSIEDILGACAKDVGKAPAFFYFDFTDGRKQSCESMIKALIGQLSRRCVNMPSGLDQLYTSCSDGQHQPSIDALILALEQLVLEFPETYIILDALDECSDRDKALKSLQRLQVLNANNLHILCIDLQASVVDEDIRHYVDHRWSNDKALEKWAGKADIRSEVEQALFHRTNGMFRWTACQLDTLGTCLNRAQLRRALRNLPKDLAETYRRILCSINSDHTHYAQRVLLWLAFCRRPLRVQEIAEIVAIDTYGRGRFDEDEILENPENVLTICRSLVTVTREKASGRQFVILAHYSVQEYLMSIPAATPKPLSLYRAEPDNTNAFIAQCCLVYLLRFQTPGVVLTGADIDKYPLITYSAQFWTQHAWDVEVNTDAILPRIMDLLSAGTSAYRTWIQLGHINTLGCRDYLTDPNVEPNPLLSVLQCGLDKVVECLIIEKTATSRAEREAYEDALRIASMHGNEKIVELLLCAGTAVDGKCARQGNALHIASHEGKDRVVEQLLHAGADVNAEGGRNGSALQAASNRGWKKIIKRLLQAGADVNQQGGSFGTPLQACVLLGDVKIAELLLQAAGAEVNRKSGFHGFALHAASGFGNEATVECLLGAGADVNAQGGFYNSAIQAAASNGNTAIIAQLLHAGADVNALGGEYGSALDGAVLFGHEKALEQLLHAGADVSAKSGFFGSAIQGAAINADAAIVGHVLHAGADVDTLGGKHGSALAIASHRGYEEVVERLLRAGTDVNAQFGELQNALQAAATRGNVKVVEILLRAGADIERHGLAALKGALQGPSKGMRKGVVGPHHEEVAKMLRQAGVKEAAP